nr:MAG TPA: hypothetical protein [Caudoviricetes sp.]
MEKAEIKKMQIFYLHFLSFIGQYSLIRFSK